MTDHTRALERRVRPWIERADRLVADRLADARSHAWHAITGRVVAAQDGRRTLAAASQTRSMGAATDRLAELLGDLAGPSATSTKGLIREARAEFYRGSFDLWAGVIPDVILDPDAGPTKAGERAARSLAIHGYELRTELAGPIESARRALLAAVTLAGARSVTDKQARTLLDAWLDRTGPAVRSRVRTALSDSDVAIFNAVGRSMVAPEFRDDTEPFQA